MVRRVGGFPSEDERERERSLRFHAAMGFELVRPSGAPGAGDYDGPAQPRVQLRKRL